MLGILSSYYFFSFLINCRDDIGNVVARRQAEEEGPESRIAELAPFQMLYEDGVERLGAGSPRERVRWVGAIWCVVLFIYFESNSDVDLGMHSTALRPQVVRARLLRLSARSPLSIVRSQAKAAARVLDLLRRCLSLQKAPSQISVAPSPRSLVPRSTQWSGLARICRRPMSLNLDLALWTIRVS